MFFHITKRDLLTNSRSLFVQLTHDYLNASRNSEAFQGRLVQEWFGHPPNLLPIPAAVFLRIFFQTQIIVKIGQKMTYSVRQKIIFGRLVRHCINHLIVLCCLVICQTGMAKHDFTAKRPRFFQQITNQIRLSVVGGNTLCIRIHNTPGTVRNRDKLTHQRVQKTACRLYISESTFALTAKTQAPVFPVDASVTAVTALLFSSQSG